jgi:hypothetical protein
MKKKILIISASVAILALIIVMGFYVQGGSKGTCSATTEQTDKGVPEKCKKCPSYSKCAEGKDQTAQTAACESKCGEKKSCGKEMKCEGMKVKGDSTCTRDKKSCSDTTKCAAKMKESKDCPKSAACEKKCEKKSN